MLSDLSSSLKRLSCNFLYHFKKISLTETETNHDIGSTCLLDRKAPLCASLTVEAALAVPLFAFFLLSTLYLFQLELLEMQIREALYDAAQQIAAVSFLGADSGEDQDAAAVLTSAGAGSIDGMLQIGSQIQDTSLLNLVVGGRAGIVCVQQDADSNDVVLSATALVHLPLFFLPDRYLAISEKASVRKWNGYDPDDTSEKGMVYVTAEGEVLHKDRDCSYLNPSVRAVSALQLDGERNADGAKYKRCPICGKQDADGVYYVTDYGTVCHSSLDCSGIKRTIYVVPEDEAQDLPFCSRCGKEEDGDSHVH